MPLPYSFLLTQLLSLNPALNGNSYSKEQRLRIKWKQKYGGMTISEAKRLRALASENSRLKKLLSERTLELDALQDVLHAAVA
jgi:hypothetical protein